MDKTLKTTFRHDMNLEKQLQYIASKEDRFVSAILVRLLRDAIIEWEKKNGQIPPDALSE